MKEGVAGRQVESRSFVPKKRQIMTNTGSFSTRSRQEVAMQLVLDSISAEKGLGERKLNEFKSKMGLT